MNIGERLKKERERKGLTLDEVHSRLRIHPTILTQIEDNRFDVLPAPIYTKGFIRRYSEFLELNPQEILAEYEGLNIKGRVALEIPPPSRETTAASQALVRNGAPLESARPLIVRGLAFVLTVTVIWIGAGAAWNALSHRGASHRVAAPQAPARKEAPQEPRAEPQNLIYSAAQGNFPKIGAKDALHLRISVNTEAWTKIIADGSTAYEGILRPGQAREWAASKTFEVKMGRPAAVSLSVNGMNLGSPAAGQATHIRITRDGVERLR